MNKPPNIHLHHFLVKRIPVFIAHRRRLPIAFARIRVDHDADEAEIVDASIDLVKGIFYAYPGILRQATDGAEFFRFHLDLQRQRVVDRLAIPMNDLLRLGRVHHRVGSGGDKCEVRPDLVENFRMLGATPLRPLDMLLRYNGAGRAMESRAIDQTRLERLELLARDDMGVNIENHNEILSMCLASYYQRSIRPSKQPETGVLEY